VKTLADFPQIQTFEVKQLYCSPLKVAQIEEGLIEPLEVEPGADFPLQIRTAGGSSTQLIGIEIRAQIESAPRKMLLAIAGPAIGDLDDPHLCRSAGGLKGCCFSKQVKEALLHHFFGFSSVLKDAQSYPVNQPGVTAEEHIQSLRILTPQEVDEPLIAQRMTVRRFGNGRAAIPLRGREFQPSCSRCWKDVNLSEQAHSPDRIYIAGQSHHP